MENLGNNLAGDKTLFLIDDIMADETLDKRRQPLLGLAISGRHKGHSVWLLTQSYTAISLNFIVSQLSKCLKFMTFRDISRDVLSYAIECKYLSEGLETFCLH